MLGTIVRTSCALWARRPSSPWLPPCPPAVFATPAPSSCFNRLPSSLLSAAVTSLPPSFPLPPSPLFVPALETPDFEDPAASLEPPAVLFRPPRPPAATGPALSSEPLSEELEEDDREESESEELDEDELGGDEAIACALPAPAPPRAATPAGGGVAPAAAAGVRGASFEGLSFLPGREPLLLGDGVVDVAAAVFRRGLARGLRDLALMPRDMSSSSSSSEDEEAPAELESLECPPAVVVPVRPTDKKWAEDWQRREGSEAPPANPNKAPLKRNII